ncbi:hypothetical protein ACFYW6_40050 [Streptomyces sp. NPDC002659]|uniref:hypothetical protein n=1 Tax=Streptomyces sp. NPDC002659 TaxID=3364656 RepID=UPI0036B7D664
MAPMLERSRTAGLTAALLALCAFLTVTALTVTSSHHRAVVVIGASVSGGHSTTPGAAWPEHIDQRLNEAGLPVSLVNASRGATRLLTRNDEGRPSALDRQDRDALAVPGVRTIVLTDVINDIRSAAARPSTPTSAAAVFSTAYSKTPPIPLASAPPTTPATTSTRTTADTTPSPKPPPSVDADTVNRELSIARKAIGWWQRQGWIECDPTIGIERRLAPPDRTKALAENQIAALWRLDVSLREKTPWKMLYESAARADEVLCLKMEDLYPADKRGKITAKDGATEWIP